MSNVIRLVRMNDAYKVSLVCCLDLVLKSGRSLAKPSVCDYCRFPLFISSPVSLPDIISARHHQDHILLLPCSCRCRRRCHERSIIYKSRPFTSVYFQISKSGIYSLGIEGWDQLVSSLARSVKMTMQTSERQIKEQYGWSGCHNHVRWCAAESVWRCSLPRETAAENVTYMSPKAISTIGVDHYRLQCHRSLHADIVSKRYPGPFISRAICQRP